MEKFGIPKKSEVRAKEREIEELKKDKEFQENFLEAVVDPEELAEHYEKHGELLAEQSKKLTEELAELQTRRAEDPEATELFDIDTELEELGTLWDRFKDEFHYKVSAVMAPGAAAASAAAFSSGNNFQGSVMALMSFATIVTNVNLIREEIKHVERLKARREELTKE